MPASVSSHRPSSERTPAGGSIGPSFARPLSCRRRGELNLERDQSRERSDRPFGDIVARIAPPDEAAQAEVRQRQDRLMIPPGSLGRLERLTIQIAGITGQRRPRLPRKLVIVVAGDHGVTVEGVSAYPSEVTAQ